MNFNTQFIVPFIQEFFDSSNPIEDVFLLKHIGTKLEEVREREQDPKQKKFYGVLIDGLNETMRRAENVLHKKEKVLVMRAGAGHELTGTSD